MTSVAVSLITWNDRENLLRCLRSLRAQRFRSMRIIVVVSIGCLASLPNVVGAQTWSADEEDLLSHVRACWETKALEDYAEIVAVCNISEDIVYWPATEAVPPTDLSWFYESNAASFPGQDLIADDFRPLRISRQGDTFLVFYIGRRVYRRPDGELIQAQWKGLDVWRRVGTVWSLVAGMDVDGGGQHRAT